MRKATQVLITITLFGLFLGGSSIVMAQDPVTAGINAPSEVEVDIDFTATVDITDLVDFDAGQFDVSFDDTVLRLDDVTAGMVGATEIPVALWNEISSGTYRTILNVPGLPGVDGSGYLAVLHFHVIGLAGSSSDITFSNGFLNNNVSEEIPAIWVDDTLTVITAEGTVTASIDTPPDVVADSDFTATVDITDLVDFDAGQFDVSFDDTVLRLDDVTAGLIGATEVPVSFWNQIGLGTYRTVVNVPGVPGVNGSGYLAILHFHVIGSAGSGSDITLSNGFLNNTLAEEIPATWVGSSTTVYDHLVVTTASLPDGVVGDAYSAIFECVGGNGSYDWSISSGSLPDGLSLSPWGEISGIPANGDDYSFTVEVTDGTLYGSKDITIDIHQPDINNDGSINILDMITVGQHLGETGSNGWIPEDINEDGTVNILDIILIGQHWTG